MAYTEVSIEINPLSEELISDFLISELGFGGIVLEEKIYEKTSTGTIDLPNANEALFDPKGESHVIKAYIEELQLPKAELEANLLTKRQELINCGIPINNLGSWSVSLKIIEDDSWAENWKQYWDVQKIGKQTIICPSWLEYSPKENEILLDLDPGAAFGTGTHQTTRLCIRELEAMNLSNLSIADVGCGSGILSIAAKKYGSAEIIGVDIDETSIEVAQANALKNNVECEFNQGSAKDIKGQHDLVIANILAHIIIDILPDLTAILKQNGTMLLSGIIEEQKDKMLCAIAKQNLEVVNESQEDEWLCLCVKHKVK